MKAGILYGDRDIRVGEVPDPPVRPGEVVVRSECAGICGTDLHIYRGEFHGRVPFPAIQGHEFGGVIEAVGPGVTHLHAGERVVVDPIVSCGSCPACLTGRINACRTLKLLGIDMGGGYGQYVAAPANHVFPLPDDVPMRYAPMVEMYGLGCHVLSRGHVQPGETVVILGVGKLGLSVLDVLCHHAGPTQTLVTDLQPFRLETAMTLGADHAVDVRAEDPLARVMELTGGEGVDCVIECIGHAHDVPGRDAPLQQAVQMIRTGGRIVTCGLGEERTAVHFKTLVIKEAELIASRVTLGEFPRAIRLLSKKLLHPELLVTHGFPMRDITSAFAQVDREDPATIKIVLDVQEA
jgi:threonine dehydrogenase-like Zn-dependent dehydrogenase